MGRNLFWFERALRVPLGALMLVLGLTDVAPLLAPLGGLMLATGLVGYCPLYTIFGHRFDDRTVAARPQMVPAIRAR
jgi:hypothetical protein